MIGATKRASEATNNEKIHNLTPEFLLQFILVRVKQEKTFYIVQSYQRLTFIDWCPFPFWRCRWVCSLVCVFWLTFQTLYFTPLHDAIQRLFAAVYRWLTLLNVARNFKKVPFQCSPILNCINCCNFWWRSEWGNTGVASDNVLKVASTGIENNLRFN